jgi:hypothetical protein
MADHKKLAKLFKVRVDVIKKCISSCAKSTGYDRKTVMTVLSDHYTKYAEFFEYLPPEINTMILEGLSVKDIVSFCMSTKANSQYCNDPYLWRALLLRDLGIEKLHRPTKDLSMNDPKKVYASIISLGKNLQKSEYFVLKPSKDEKLKTELKRRKFTKQLAKICDIGGATMFYSFLETLDAKMFKKAGAMHVIVLAKLLVKKFLLRQDYEIIRDLARLSRIRGPNGYFSRTADSIYFILRTGLAAFVNKKVLDLPYAKYTSLVAFYEKVMSRGKKGQILGADVEAYVQTLRAARKHTKQHHLNARQTENLEYFVRSSTYLPT